MHPSLSKRSNCRVSRLLALLLALSCAAAAGVAAAKDRPVRKASFTPEEWKHVNIDQSSHAGRPASRVAGCEVSGSLSARIFAAEGASQPVLQISGGDVASMRPAASGAGRMPVRIEWPILMTGWVDANETPFVLQRRIEIVKDHLWLGRGALLSAHSEKGGRVTVVRPGGRTAVRPVPDGHTAVVSCEDIGLADVDRSAEEPPAGRSGVVHGEIRLFDAPKGRTLAKLPPLDSPVPGVRPFPLDVRVIETKGDWTRIRAFMAATALNSLVYQPFDLDGWIEAPVLEEDSGLLGAIIPATAPTQLTIAPAPLRRGPSASAPVVADLATGAIIVTGRRENGFTAIKVAGLYLLPETDDLWISDASLRAVTRPGARSK
jgi:hypothetical protein